MLHASYILNEPDIVSEAFDGEYVLLNLSNGTYYSLRDSGNLLWEALIGGASPLGMLEAMDAAGNAQAAAARDFFARVVALDLLRPVETGEAAPLPPALLEKLGAIDTPPRVEIFDDLADLLLADPVHDADEQKGWPATKPDAS